MAGVEAVPRYANAEQAVSKSLSRYLDKAVQWIESSVYNSVQTSNKPVQKPV